MDLFLRNKYTIWYFNIIRNATTSNRSKKDGTYYEEHHITPRCLGGNNTKFNLVLLTAKEHFICHLLLPKMTEGDTRRKMAWALWNMTVVKGNSKQYRHKISARTFENIRKFYKDITSGIPRTEEVKEKLRIACKTNPHIMYGEDNPSFEGYYHTPWGKYASSRLASKACPYGLDRKRVARSCKESDQVIIRRKPISIPSDWVGKTHRQIGFWFEPVDK